MLSPAKFLEMAVKAAIIGSALGLILGGISNLIH
jgi:hypothetical protein